MPPFNSKNVSLFLISSFSAIIFRGPLTLDNEKVLFAWTGEVSRSNIVVSVVMIVPCDCSTSSGYSYWPMSTKCRHWSAPQRHTKFNDSRGLFSLYWWVNSLGVIHSELNSSNCYEVERCCTTCISYGHILDDIIQLGFEPLSNCKRVLYLAIHLEIYYWNFLRSHYKRSEGTLFCQGEPDAMCNAFKSFSAKYLWSSFDIGESVSTVHAIDD